MAESLIKCPRCGNENRAEAFSCSFCGKRLRIEKIDVVFLELKDNSIPFLWDTTGLRQK